jgi:DNA-binding protein Fis
MSPTETIAREVRKIVAFELARTEGRPVPLHSAVMGAAEKPLLEAVLHHHGWNQSHAALTLGISRNTLHKKIKEHGIR